jgi:cobalt-zinc-cadmium efflux system membrane fusion protein
VISLTNLERALGASPSFFVLVLVGAFSLGACGGSDDVPAEAPAAEEHAGAEGVVVLDTAAIRLGGIQVSEVASVTTSALAVTGSITFDADRVSHVGSRSDGRIVAVHTDLGAQVQRGEALATLESVEVGQIRAEEREAEALLKIAQENHAREQRLAEQGISSRKELLEAESMLRRAEAALHSAEDRLKVLGASHDHGAGGEFTLVAPFAGVVVARDASLGEMATPADTLFTVADLSEVWIELDIFERDLARVKRGQSVAVLVSAYPSRSFPGRIVYVGDVLDPAKRTVRARVEIPNRDGALKPGMFATANIQVGGGGPPMAVVPQDAVQTVEGKLVVFVPGDAPGEFRAVPVAVGPTTDGNRIIILSGIAPGSRVVTAGAFALRSELGKGEIGEHGH